MGFGSPDVPELPPEPALQIAPPKDPAEGDLNDDQLKLRKRQREGRSALRIQPGLNTSFDTLSSSQISGLKI